MVCLELRLYYHFFFPYINVPKWWVRSRLDHCTHCIKYCFQRVSQPSVSQPSLILVLIQMSCFHFPFLKVRLHCLKAFYCF